MTTNLQNLTNVIPKELFGTGVVSGSEVSMNVSATGIILQGDLNTATPITATISQAGIITDNPTGFDILSSLNMNSQNITNTGTISGVSGSNLILENDSDIYINGGMSSGNIYMSATDGVSVSSSDGGVSLSTGTGGNAPIALNSAGDINLNSIGAMNLTAGSNLFLSGEIISISNPNGFTNSITLNNTTGDTTIASAFGSVNITSGNGDAGDSSISLFAVEGDIVLNTGSGFQVSSNAPITSSVGYTGKVYHTDQPTTALTYYLTFVQSGGVSGYYEPSFDSATLTYNPSTNLLSVSGLQLSGATITSTFSAGVLTCGCNESSSRQFQFGMTANITGLTLSNRRTNGVYTCSIYNVSGSTWTISNVLSGAASNKTDYSSPISIANGEFAVLTARTLLANGTAYNFVSVMKFA